VLALRDVRKRYGANVAVDGLSLEVRAGEVLGLLGPNGAGKSTTLSLAVGLLAPDGGEVVLEGLGSPRDPGVRRRIGLAPQALALYEPLTARENLAFFARVQGVPPRDVAARVEWAIELAGLADRGRDRVDTFSGGMKRRLNLVAALVHDPALVLLDEPTVGVDPQSRNAILERILELRRMGRTIVYATHYMEEAERLCDRVAIVDHGRVLALGTVAELVRLHGGEPVLVASLDGVEQRIPARDPARALLALARERHVEDFRVERATLETVFLNLTGRRLRDA
jgi:ABC-2 type transport system ATP-binding protein